MSEPRKLYSPDGLTVATAYTPSALRELIEDGWLFFPPLVDAAPVVIEVTLDATPETPAAPVAKRGRPKKTT